MLQFSRLAVATASLLMFLLVVLMFRVSTTRGFSSLSPKSTSLESVLPKDLDALRSRNVIGALGIQLLAFGGWVRDENDNWTRRYSRSSNGMNPSWTLSDRLTFITPTWKKGGSLDYSTIFRDGTALLDNLAVDDGSNMHGDDIKTVSQLANLLEHRVGLSASTDLDRSSIAALTAMLTWNIPASPAPLPTISQGNNSDLVLLVFSFGNEESCRNRTDCPFGPGATNELLASTVARFAQQQDDYENVHILAQWEVATGLWQRHENITLNVESFGTPGAYASTVEILQKMLCALGEKHPSVKSVLLVAHPDHLRRVLWTTRTAQTILRRHHTFLRDQKETNCQLSADADIRLWTAMQPYGLDWPERRNQTSILDGNIINLFDTMGLAEVHIGRNEIICAEWYDKHLGFFDVGDQEWTKQRDDWILYDQWAVLKNIVAGTIDLKSISQA